MPGPVRIPVERFDRYGNTLEHGLFLIEYYEEIGHVFFSYEGEKKTQYFAIPRTQWAKVIRRFAREFDGEVNGVSIVEPPSGNNDNGNPPPRKRGRPRKQQP